MWHLTQHGSTLVGHLQAKTHDKTSKGYMKLLFPEYCYLSL